MRLWARVGARELSPRAGLSRGMARPLPPVAALAEVGVSLGGTLLDVRHIGRGAEASPWSPWLPRYTLGEGPQAQLPVALAGCDARGCFTLVEAAGPAICLRLAPAMLGSVRRGGAELAVAGAAGARRDDAAAGAG